MTYCIPLFLISIYSLISAVPSWAAGSALIDADMNMLDEMFGKSFTFVHNVAIFFASIYYVVCLIKYYQESSPERGRQHIIKGMMAVVIVFFAKPIIDFLMGNFFGGGTNNAIALASLEGKELIKKIFEILRKMVTMTAIAGEFFAGLYVIVASIKYQTSDNPTEARDSIIRVLVGMVLLGAAVSFLNVMVYIAK